MENNGFHSGDILSIKGLGREIEIDIRGEEPSAEYVDKCVKLLTEMPEDMRMKIYESAKKYCLFFIDLCREAAGDNFDPADFPPVTKDTPAEKMCRYFNIYTAGIVVPDDGSTPAIDLSGGCIWEPEHGIEICILGTEVVYLGAFEGRSPTDSFDPDDEWNFAND